MSSHGFSIDGSGTTYWSRDADGTEIRGFTPHSEEELLSIDLVRRNRHCRVYWGSHGCNLERGHRDPHECDEDCPPRGYGHWWRVFGEDSWWFLRAWRWLIGYPGAPWRLWWLLRHRRPWPQVSVREWERFYGVPWPYGDEDG